MQENLGRGTYGTVYKSKKLAIKQFKRLPHMVQESMALMYLNDCQYVVHAKSVNYNKLQLGMQLYNLSLRQYLKKECTCNRCLMKIIHDILLGMIELHDRDLSHSDIKCSNILIQLNPLKAVLGDCGFVSVAKYSKQSRTAPAYRDINIHYDLKHDMFSFGICLLELLYDVPLKVYKHYNEIKNVINHYVKNKKYRHLIHNLLNENRHERLSSREVLKLIFNEEPAHWVKPAYLDVSEMIKNVNHKYNHKLIPLTIPPFHVKRAKFTIHALYIHLYQNQVPSNMLFIYVTAIWIISSSLFSHYKIKMEDIYKFSHFVENETNIHLLNSVLHTLTHDIIFVNHLLGC